MADLFGEKVINVSVEDEIKKSYIDYSMSVIVGRALPDIRDGLKPVHRRILFAMEEMNCLPDKPYKKSARIVGEVLGKFHPHGDIAVYDSLVRMTQPFSLSYPLIDGHGNFGSIDGDAPAAMRYTEVRLEKIAMEMLSDLDKNTVDFTPNFDNTLKEPIVLPAKIPNLLINGSSGIAVGMATNIPPHNLQEIIDALVYIIDNEILGSSNVTAEELLKIIKGPDFPTAGIVVGEEGIKKYFNTGRGVITIRGRAHIEEKKGGKRYFIITEIPYGVNKANLVEKIATLTKAKKLTEVEDIRDESDKDGIRISIKLSRGANVNVFENKLRLHTPFEERFGVILLGVLNNVPKVFSMKELLMQFLLFRKEILLRKTSFELEKAKEHLEILEGLFKAIQQIDLVIKIIRKSKNPQEASRELKTLLSATDKQVKAILEMKLSRLTNMETEKIKADIESTKKDIAFFTEVLKNEEKPWKLIKKDLLRIKAKYGRKRKTEIIPSENKIDIEDLIADEKVIVSSTYNGYIKRLPENIFKLQHYGGKGVLAHASNTEDYPNDIYGTTTKATMLFFTNIGKVYSLKVYEIPEAKRESKGTPIHRLLKMNSSEKLSAILPSADETLYKYLFMVTEKGIVKKTKLSDFTNISINGKIAIRLREGDELVAVRPVGEDDEVLIVTKNGQAIRFSVNEVRAMGRNASGVKGIKLSKDDAVVGMEVLKQGEMIFIVTEKGFGKRVHWEKFRKTKRGGKGIKCARTDTKRGKVKAIHSVETNSKIFIISKNGNVIKIKASKIPILGRTAGGVMVVRFKTKDDTVSSVTVNANENNKKGTE